MWAAVINITEKKLIFTFYWKEKKKN